MEEVELWDYWMNLNFEDLEDMGLWETGGSGVVRLLDEFEFLGPGGYGVVGN